MNDIERKLVQAVLEGTLKPAPQIEKVNNWFLAIVGSALGLFISQFASLKGVISGGGIYCLIAAGVLGCVARLYGLSAQQRFLVIQSVTESLPEIVRGVGRDQIDSEKVIGGIIAAFPNVFEKYIRSSFLKGVENPLHAHQRAARCLFWQSAILGLAMFVAFVGVTLIAYRLGV